MLFVHTLKHKIQLKWLIFFPPISLCLCVCVYMCVCVSVKCNVTRNFSLQNVCQNLIWISQNSKHTKRFFFFDIMSSYDMNHLIFDTDRERTFHNFRLFCLFVINFFEFIFHCSSPNVSIFVGVLISVYYWGCTMLSEIYRKKCFILSKLEFWDQI